MSGKLSPAFNVKAFSEHFPCSVVQSLQIIMDVCQMLFSPLNRRPNIERMNETRRVECPLKKWVIAVCKLWDKMGVKGNYVTRFLNILQAFC